MTDEIILNYDESLRKFNSFREFYKTKNIAADALQFNTNLSMADNLAHLAVTSLDSDITTSFLFALDKVFLDFASRWISDSSVEYQYLQSKNIATAVSGSIVLRALGRIISLAPEISPLVEYFLDHNDILSQLETAESISQDELRETLLAYYRLLHFDHGRFQRFLSPKTLSSILNSSSLPTIKFLAIELLSRQINMSEKAKNDMIKTFLHDASLEAVFENDQHINYKFLAVLEAQRQANFITIQKSFESEPKSSDTYIRIENSSLSHLIVSVCGVLVPKIHFDQPFTKSSDFIPTERSINTLRDLSHQIQHSKPVMLVGNAGSGKTFIINELSKYLSCDKTVVKIHLGDQTDAKLLLGTYTSGKTPGTFEWRSGILTTAVREGRWVLIEDIDKAPTEVLSILLTLLEKRELTIPSRGEVVKAANGFQLLSTIRTSSLSKKTTIPDLIGLRLWKVLSIEDPSKEELDQILESKYPILKKLIPTFLHLYEVIQETYSNKSFLVLNKGTHPRIVSVRDLIKFCKRVNVIFLNNGIKDTSQLLESSVLDSIFSEAVDCFASAISEPAALNPLINNIGEALQIASSRIKLFLQKHVPSYEDFEDKLVIGRAHLKKAPQSLYRKKNTGNNTSFARTNHSLRLMEQIGVSIQLTEPVLLVGETGTGKTTVVQQVAKQLNKQITVINVSQQTEAGDLLGGFKPVNTKSVALPIQENFLTLFHLTFSSKKNEKFERMLIKCFNRNQWKSVAKLWNEAVKLAKSVLNKTEEEIVEEGPKKKKRHSSNDKVFLLQKWEEFTTSVSQFEAQAQAMNNSFVFDFVEGSLVQAVRNGDWLLLDEINLASSDTLESISDLLSDIASQRSILLSEKGEVESIQAHKDFRIFACMNPATDVGKRDLPLSIRSRFTEIYVHSPDSDVTDLLQIIDKYVGRYALTDEWVGNDIAELYLEAKRLSDSNQIVDGANQKPHFSIRTLTRTLLYVCDIVSIYGLRRSLFEGFSMAFLTLLDQKSESLLKPLIEKYTIGRLKNAKSVISQIPPAPPSESGSFVQFKHYWMKKGTHSVVDQPNYIITPFVEKNMLNLVRATSGKRFPILVQGPTSAGKTSMIKYLADITGNKFVRINNHEHTDLQEYLGTYLSDDTGKLVFKEGVLVEALRKGHWLVLDELNLAPTDVLEALNRLLDDNRELFIPETQEVVHPHPEFMLFATQNPPGLYGGRKVLSRAFRNRFLELHFDDIPQDELEIILRERCQIAPTYAKKIVEVYRQLSVQRQSSRLFEQKNSFATLRDLFRWAMREAVGYEQLAANGYMLLAERVRKSEEKLVVKEILEKVMRVKIDMDSYYDSLENKELLNLESSIVWTKAIRRLAVLISTSLNNNEPILLVGETGCGKTTVCQLLAQFNNKKLITVNAHQNTETGDLLGAQRPVRNKSGIQQDLFEKIKRILTYNGEQIDSSADLDDLIKQYDSINQKSISDCDKDDIKNLRDCLKVLFEWSDGPLIQALKNGQYFLLDEISLADDSVLERLNSVLEPERSLLLAEKGADDSSISAAEGFQFLATMNPGGDYGKKELSPALRNRFTEIWVPSMEDLNDVLTIVESKLDDEVKDLAPVIVKFSESFGMNLGGGSISSGVISLRDILAWVEFLNSTYKSTNSKNGSLLHGAAMVFIDALGTNNTAHLAESQEKLQAQKLDYVKELSQLVGEDLTHYYTDRSTVTLSDHTLQVGLFNIPRDLDNAKDELFSFEAPTSAANAMRVVRSLQLTKPIMLEGSPGVGKTSLVSALAKVTGHALTRINLSEQTDLVDLFGSDAPVEGGKTGEFSWRDAPFLRAMKQGEWVLLDEMNLASQSVLEGLNACLDHRGEVYIPELDKSFPRHPNFLVFAAQNPQYQGGGRKGLPKSFVNRFSVVYVETLNKEDLVLISHHLYPQFDADVCAKMIEIVSRLEEEVTFKKSWGASGGPWEFNLRDTLRWLEVFKTKALSENLSPVDFIDIIICQRFRTENDRSHAREIVRSVFPLPAVDDNLFAIGDSFIQSKKAVLARDQTLQLTNYPHLAHLQSNTSIVESSILAIQHGWPLVYVGPTNAGKTDLVRYLASVSGSKVVEFAMNSDIDSMDILGGYEQVDLTRKLTSLIQKLSVKLRSLLADYFKHSTEISDGIKESLSLLKFITDTSVSLENFGVFFTRIQNFFSIVHETSSFDNIKGRIQELYLETQKPASVKFEWFDGLLVKAVEEGHWLVLDNANLCSPSVLDRLNSLLEINGSLIINECSMADGQPRILKPHKDFRLFLTMDPKFGELSRAMRNRSVEIYIESLNYRSNSFDKSLLGIEPFKLKTDVSDLTQLSVSETRDTALTKFIESGDSFSHYISLVLDTFFFNQKQEGVARVLTTLVPFISQVTLDALKQTISNSTEFPVTVSTFLTELTSYINHFTQIGITKSIYNLYSRASERANELANAFVNFENYQSLNPLWNSFVLSIIKSESGTSSSELVHFFELLASLYDSLKKLEAVELKGSSGKINELSYIEQGAAIESGRNLKNAPRLNIYKLLKGLYDYLISTVYEFSAQSIIESTDVFQHLYSVTLLWHSLYESSLVKNDAKTRVYQKLIQKWASDSEKVVRVNELNKLLDSFENDLKLTRGTLMTPIWEKFRGLYPHSGESWAAYTDLKALMAEFDSVAFKQFSDSEQLVASLGSAILGLQSQIVSQSTASTECGLEALKSGIKNLDKISSEFLIKRSHNFEESFRLLFNFSISDRTTIDDGLLSMAQYAGLGVSAISTFENDIYPRVFDGLWPKSSGRYQSLTSSLFTDKFLQRVMSNIGNYEDFSGDQLDQTVQDSMEFSKQLINNSRSVLLDRLQEHKSIISNWYIKIAGILNSELFLTLPGNWSASALESIIVETSNITDDIFQKVNQSFFIPALSLLAELHTLEELGQAWVLFSIGLIQLYVPDSPFDPAIEDHILYENFERRKVEAATVSEAIRSIRSIFFGDNSITIEKHTPYVNEHDIPQKPRVYRTNISLDGLFEEWQSFMSSTVDLGALMSFLESAEDSSIEKFELQLDLFQQNTSSFMDRLQSQFHQFSDVNDIFKGYIFGLKLGFDLILESKHQFGSKYRVSPLWFINSYDLTIPHLFDFGFEQMTALTKQIDVESPLAEEILRFLMEVVLDDSSELRNKKLEQVFQALYYRWALRRTRKEQKEAEEGSVFKYKDESDSDEDFKLLFPDYDDFLETGEASIVQKSDKLEDEYYLIAKSYTDIFQKKDIASLSSLLDNGSKIVKKLSSIASDFKTSSPNPEVLAVTINKLRESIESTRCTTSGETPDFYYGYSTLEMKRSVALITKLLQSIKGLLAQWPEHATLSTLDRICHEYLSFAVKTPLAKLIQKVEQIYTFISEWEKYASTKVSLKSHFDELTGLIVTWRKLELSSWNSLFKKVEKDNLTALGGWWFNLFESIILPICSNESIDLLSLISAMNIFISKSTYGQFTARLNLLKAFTNHAEFVSDDKNLLNSLRNVITYYEQFVPTIETHLKTNKKKLQKEVEEVILLASWKDVNIDALKQSSRRSHHNLYKVVRKYRDLLDGEVSAVIEQGISPEEKVYVPKGDTYPSSFKSLEFVEHKNALKLANLLDTRPSHLNNSYLISNNMKVYGENVKGRSYPELYGFVVDVVQEMDRLKNETPKVFKEETKKVIASLKTQKRKLLSDTIRELRRFGLKYHLREDIHKLQSSSTLILSSSQSLFGTVLEKSDAYFFRIVDIMPRLKAAISELAEDVPVNDAEKGIAIIEHLVSLLIKNRTSMFDVSKAFESLEIIKKSYESAIFSTSDFRSSNLFVASRESIQHIFKWLPQIIDFAVSALSSSSHLSQTQTDSTVFVSLKARLMELKDELNSQWEYSSSMSEAQAKFSSELHSAVSSIENWKLSNVKFSFAGDIIINWIQNIGSLTVSKSDDFTTGVEELDALLRGVSSKVLVVFQKVTEVQSLPEVGYEDDKWLTFSQKELASMVKSLHFKSILKSFTQVLEYLKSKSFDITQSAIVRSLLSITQPFLKGYIELVAIILNKLKENYTDISRSTYIMSTTLYNLAKNGFCSPEPPTESKEDDNLQDGTGLGDGEGANNNSNDVEDDEDLSEQAQEPNKDRDDNKDEDDDDQDAVDIEGDMAGDLENLSDQDKSDDEGDNNEDQEEELDEEIDDLDDLDPNAVDDKMWDEEAKEDKKEKESENMPENSKADDVEAKEDEEPTESKDNNAPEDSMDQDDQEQNEDGSDGSDEEDVGEQEDEVKNQENEELDQNVPETETLDLPDDINLDSGDEEEQEDDKDDGLDENLDDEMDVDEKEGDEEKDGDEDKDQEIEDGDEADKVNEEALDLEENQEEPQPEEGDSNENEKEEEGGEDSDEELNNNEGGDNADEDKEEGDQLEGIDGAETGDNNNDDIDMDTAVEQQSGDKGDGAQAQANEERDDVGESGSANHQEQSDPQDADSTEDARDNAKESLKQLGDSLKEFHRRHQEIKEASEKDESAEQQANERPDEFEHVDGENTNTETQALGAANKDQVSSIDEDMAIDDEEEDENSIEKEEGGKADQVEDSDVEEAKNEKDETADEFNGKTKGGFIGERKQESLDDEDVIKAETNEMDINEEEDLIDEVIRDEDIENEEYRDIDEARELWRKSELETQELAANLSEQLRLILEPTLSTKLKGDYKTGKRLNMKRIIPYIASDFRKDKIWLRRTKPSKRQYQIMIAVDDSKSMSESKSVDLAFQSIYLVSKALTQLESGGLSIVKFGEDTKIVHPFEKQFTSESGANIFQKFDFQQTRTNIRKLVSESIKIFTDARTLGNADLWQLQIIISDGVCEDHDTIERLVRRAREEKIMLVFVIIDGINSNESIMDMSQVKYIADASGNMVLKVDKYLDSFPFEFYVVVHDISELPKMLSSILRQYFSELASV